MARYQNWRAVSCIQNVQDNIQDIKIVAWNANGLFQHCNRLQVFPDIKKVDISLA